MRLAEHIITFLAMSLINSIIREHKCYILLSSRVLTRILKTGFIESIPGKSWSQN